MWLPALVARSNVAVAKMAAIAGIVTVYQTVIQITVHAVDLNVREPTNDEQPQ